MFARLSSSTAAFPVKKSGRLLQLFFRGLLSVHSRYGLHARRVAKRPSTPKAPTASLPPLSLRLLPGGANQFPGGSFTRCSPAPFHGALFRQLSKLGAYQQSNPPRGIDTAYGGDDQDCCRLGISLRTPYSARLAHDGVGYLEPVRQLAYHRVHNHGLAKNESGKPVEIDGMNAPVDHQVARYTEQNQEVHAGIKHVR